MKKLLPLAIIVGIITLIIHPYIIRFLSVPVYADGECTTTLSPTSFEINTTNDFTITLTNNSSDTWRWIRVTAPDGNLYSFNFISSSGWTMISNSGVSAALGGGTFAPSSTMEIAGSVIIGDSAAAVTNWEVRVSTQADGSGAITCTGSMGTGLTNPVDLTPELSNLTISDITASSVKVSWNTNTAATSGVEYGTTDAYGASKTDTARNTAHSVTIDGLKANTTYHFRIQSTNDAGTKQSSDATFTTAAPGQTIVVTQTITNTQTVIVTPMLTPTPIPDTIPPTIKVQDIFKTIFTQSPKITGSVTDNEGVISLAYSVDDGENWLPIEIGSSFLKSPMRRTSMDFAFTPTLFDEGDYTISIRASDVNNNVGYSRKYTLTIDRLPPRVGSLVQSIGPQVLIPKENGIAYVIAGMQQRITFSAVGGPKEVQAVIVHENKKEKIPLQKNSDTGLWSGNVTNNTIGLYGLQVYAKDTAGKEDTKTVATIYSLEPGQVVDEDKKPLRNATVSLYVYDVTSDKWSLWDAKAFSQKNPQITDAGGYYRFHLPSGKYYFHIKVPDGRQLTSNIFSLREDTPLNALFTLPKSFGIAIGPVTFTFPNVFTPTVPVTTRLPSQSIQKKSALIGVTAPSFTLRTLSGSEFSSYTLRGKPSVVSFVNTWSPMALEQIAAIRNTSKTDPYQWAVVLSGEKVVKAHLFQQRGEYAIPFIVDPDGTLWESYAPYSIPSHFIIDKKGIVRKQVTGILTTEAIEKELFVLQEVNY